MPGRVHPKGCTTHRTLMSYVSQNSKGGGTALESNTGIPGNSLLGNTGKRWGSKARLRHVQLDLLDTRVLHVLVGLICRGYCVTEGGVGHNQNPRRRKNYREQQQRPHQLKPGSSTFFLDGGSRIISKCFFWRGTMDFISLQPGGGGLREPYPSRTPSVSAPAQPSALPLFVCWTQWGPGAGEQPTPSL